MRTFFDFFAQLGLEDISKNILEHNVWAITSVGFPLELGIVVMVSSSGFLFASLVIRSVYVYVARFS